MGLNPTQMTKSHLTLFTPATNPVQKAVIQYQKHSKCFADNFKVIKDTCVYLSFKV